MQNFPQNLTAQGMKNFYWHVFERTGNINDYMKYSVAKQKAEDEQTAYSIYKNVFE